MKLILLTLIVSIAILQSCQSNLEINFTEVFQDCLTTEDINQFERKLMEIYSSKNTNQNYLRFLEGFSAMNLNPDFILDSDSKTILDDLKASGTFDKIWISKLNNYKERNTESLIIEFEPKKTRTTIDIPRVDYLCINPTGNLRKCLSLNNTIDNSLKDVIDTQIKGSSLSYGLTSKSVANSITVKDLENNLNKVVIAMLFYYEIVHLTNQNL